MLSSGAETPPVPPDSCMATVGQELLPEPAAAAATATAPLRPGRTHVRGCERSPGSLDLRAAPGLWGLRGPPTASGVSGREAEAVSRQEPACRDSRDQEEVPRGPCGDAGQDLHRLRAAGADASPGQEGPPCTDRAEDRPRSTGGQEQTTAGNLPQPSKAEAGEALGANTCVSVEPPASLGPGTPEPAAWGSERAVGGAHPPCQLLLPGDAVIPSVGVGAEEPCKLPLSSGALDGRPRGPSLPPESHTATPGSSGGEHRVTAVEAASDRTTACTGSSPSPNATTQLPGPAAEQTYRLPVSAVELSQKRASRKENEPPMGPQGGDSEPLVIAEGIDAPTKHTHSLIPGASVVELGREDPRVTGDWPLGPEPEDQRDALVRSPVGGRRVDGDRPSVRSEEPARRPLEVPSASSDAVRSKDSPAGTQGTPALGPPSNSASEGERLSERGAEEAAAHLPPPLGLSPESRTCPEGTPHADTQSPGATLTVSWPPGANWPAGKRASSQVPLKSLGSSRLPVDTEMPSVASEGAQPQSGKPLPADREGTLAATHTVAVETHAGPISLGKDTLSAASDGPPCDAGRESPETAARARGSGAGMPPARLLSGKGEATDRPRGSPVEGAQCFQPRARAPALGGSARAAGPTPSSGGDVLAPGGCLATECGDGSRLSTRGHRLAAATDSCACLAGEQPGQRQHSGKDVAPDRPVAGASDSLAPHAAVHRPSAGEEGPKGQRDPPQEAKGHTPGTSEGVLPGLSRPSDISAPAPVPSGSENSNWASKTLSGKAGEAPSQQSSPHPQRPSPATQTPEKLGFGLPSRPGPERGTRDVPPCRDRSLGSTSSPGGASTHCVRPAATAEAMENPPRPPSVVGSPETEEPCEPVCLSSPGCALAMCPEPPACAMPSGGELQAARGTGPPVEGQQWDRDALLSLGSSGALPPQEGPQNDPEGCCRPKGAGLLLDLQKQEGSPGQTRGPGAAQCTSPGVGADVPGVSAEHAGGQPARPPDRRVSGSDRWGDSPDESPREPLGCEQPADTTHRSPYGGSYPDQGPEGAVMPVAVTPRDQDPGAPGEHSLRPPEAAAAPRPQGPPHTMDTEATHGAFRTSLQKEGVLDAKPQPPRMCKKPRGPASWTPPEPIPTRAHRCLGVGLVPTCNLATATNPLPKQTAPARWRSPSASQPTKESALLHRLSVLASRLAPWPPDPPGCTQLLPAAFVRPRYKRLPGGFGPGAAPLALCQAASRETLRPGGAHWTLCSLDAVRVDFLGAGTPVLPVAPSSKLSLTTFPVKPGPPALSEPHWTFPEHCAPAQLALRGSPLCLSLPPRWALSLFLLQGGPCTTAFGSNPGLPAPRGAPPDSVVPAGPSCSTLGLRTLLALCSPGCDRIWTRKRSPCGLLPGEPRLLLTQFTQGLKGLRTPASEASRAFCSLPHSLGRVLSFWSQHGPPSHPWGLPSLHSSSSKLPPLGPARRFKSWHLCKRGSGPAVPSLSDPEAEVSWRDYLQMAIRSISSAGDVRLPFTLQHRCLAPPPCVPLRSVDAAHSPSGQRRLEPALPALVPKSRLARDPAVSKLLLSASEFPIPELRELDSVKAACPPAPSGAPKQEEAKADPEKRPKRVSQIRIRKTIPRPDPNLTPMGLPRPKRLKKKEFSLEEIYTNKNYMSPPASRCLETIFEEPKERNGTLISVSQQKRKRVLEFQDFTVPRKRRARGRVAATGSFTRAQKAALQSRELDALLIQKLMDLEAFFAQEEEREQEERERTPNC